MNRFQNEKTTIIDNVVEFALEKPKSIFTQIDVRPKSRGERSKSVV